jgi:hypothetical protein
MWRSGGTKPGAEPGGRARKNWRWTAFRVLLVAIVMGAIIVFVFPLTFDPGVEAPAELEFGNPSSVVVQIGNQNVMPLLDVEYVCDLGTLTMANGTAVTNARELVRGIVRRVPARRSFAARCEAAFIVTDPIKAAEYRLTVAYQAYPWKQRRTSAYRIVAQVDSKGDVTGWKVK